MTRPTSQSLGGGWARVGVITVDQASHIATCADDKGTPYQVYVHILPGHGPTPRVGEQWIITRMFGEWTFSHVYVPLQPDTSLDAAKAVLEAQLGLGGSRPSQDALNVALATVLLALSNRI